MLWQPVSSSKASQKTAPPSIKANKYTQFLFSRPFMLNVRKHKYTCTSDIKPEIRGNIQNTYMWDILPQTKLVWTFPASSIWTIPGG